MDRTIPIKQFPEMTIISDQADVTHSIELTSEQDGVYIYSFRFSSVEAIVPKPVTLHWKLPALNIKGVWTSGSLYEKRLQYDWELDHLQSRVSVNAPVVSVFGHDDQNVISFASSDAINKLEMNALLREEDVHLYCHVAMFTEKQQAITEYASEIRVDTRNIDFSKSLGDISSWWAQFEQYKPAFVPEIARSPLYSTWYNFHQHMEEDILIEECRIASSLGYKLIIIDDGWQTLDTNRGYDYCGDWQPDRFPDLAGLVDKLHEVGMQVGIWFSVPFCGNKSMAYQTFKGKFLTEDHRWAPVFDPRYPDVREHLIQIYAHAVESYNLDALKLDFIDEFKAYPDTELTLDHGRDYANINEAVDRLMSDVMDRLRDIKQDIAIEFRQKYTGPGMRKYGNMFRAFDCPNDPVSNRIRTTDVKLLCGNSAVHADMHLWHPDEKVELAAIQILNTFFSVPQLSVHLRLQPESHLAMIKFYNQLWIDLAAIVLDGEFIPKNPIAHYPLLQAKKDNKTVIGVYENAVVDIGPSESIHVLNAKQSDNIVFKYTGTSTRYKITIYNCQGVIQTESEMAFENGISEHQVPVAGMIKLAKR